MNKTIKQIFLLIVLMLGACLILPSCNNKKEVYHEVWVFDEDYSDFYNVLDGDTFTYNDYADKADYIYEGLYLDDTFTTKYDETSKVTNDLNLYAHYVKEKVVVIFDPNGGNGGTTRKVKYNNTVDSPNVLPIKLYGEFICWCTDKEGNNPFDFTTPIKSDLTLYAKYKEVSYDGIIEEYIPDVIDQNLNFVLPDNSLNYIWSSSDETIINNVGTYLPAREDKEVTIKLTITAGGNDFVEYTKKALVKGYSLPELEVGNVVIGYSSSWYLGEYTNGYSSEILNTCNVINICFGYVKADGTLNLNEMTSFPRYITECHKKGIRVLLSIQGSSSAGTTKEFAACAKDATLRKTLAQSMADACVKYNLDGIDIDWEYPVGDEKFNYTFLMEEIRKSLDNLGEDYLLTSAIPGGSWGASIVEMTKVSAIFDYINMMSYDLEGTDTGSHHTALYKSTTTNGTRPGATIEEAVALWHDTYSVPYNKIVLGCAFYGKPAMCNSTPNQKVLGNVKTNVIKNVRYSVILDTYFAKFGTENYKYFYAYDSSTEAPYIYSYYGTTSKTGYFITYDNENSLIAKCEYAKKMGLCGVMIWELGEDNTNNLITSVAQGMNRHLDNKPYIIYGNQTFKVGDVITIKACEELELSNYNISYKSSDNNIVSINNNTCTFNKEGSCIIGVYDANNELLQSMSITVIK